MLATICITGVASENEFGPRLLATSSSNSTDAHDDHGSHDESASLVVFFLAFSLIAGCFLNTLCYYLKLPVPYTVLMLLMGMALGATDLSQDRNDWFAKSMNMYANIDPHLLLTIFLPALIFESAFSTSYHIVRREIGQAMLLAGPGVLISMCLTAVVAKYTFTYKWDWYASMLFGSILSATDPVAVVALLRELGASKRLATLIEGESLFNDGTAYVLFLIWKDFLSGKELTAGQIVISIFQLALGGFLFGVALALPAISWISVVYNNPAVETSITFAAAYLCFWLAESSYAGIHVSGVLAVVGLGLVISKFKFYISVQAEEVVHHFWEMIGFMANTLIFLISGIVVAQRVMSSSRQSDIGGKDFGYLLLLYILIHFIRGISIGCLIYPMSRLGYGFNWQQGAVVCYGGLRGAVGLALALMADLEKDIPDEVSDKILFHVSGIVFLTLVVNGSTTGLVLKWVGLSNPKAPTLRAFRNAIEKIKDKSDKRAIQLSKQKTYKLADWGLVKKYLPKYEHKARDLVLNYVSDLTFEMSEEHTHIVGKRRSMAAITTLSSSTGPTEEKTELKTAKVSEEELRQEIVARFLTAMSANFFESFEDGELSRQVRVQLSI